MNDQSHTEIAVDSPLKLLSGLTLTAPKSNMADFIILKLSAMYPTTYFVATSRSGKLEVGRMGKVEKCKTSTGKLSDLPEAVRNKLLGKAQP